MVGKGGCLFDKSCSFRTLYFPQYRKSGTSAIEGKEGTEQTVTEHFVVDFISEDCPQPTRVSGCCDGLARGFHSREAHVLAHDDDPIRNR